MGNTINPATVTASQLKALRTDAGQHGDLEMAAIADVAINGDDTEYMETYGKRISQVRAIDLCCEVLESARAEAV